VRLIAERARVEHLLGHYTQAQAGLEDALARTSSAESPEAAALMIELAVASIYRLDYDAMAGLASRAVDATLPLGNRALTAEALAVRALATVTSGEASEAGPHRDEAAELVDELPDEVLARRLGALVYLATADLYLDRIDAAALHAERALTIGRETGQGDLFPTIIPVLGRPLWMSGRIAEACELLDGAIESARLLDNRHTLAWSLYNRSTAALPAGDVETALALAEESFELARQLDETPISIWAAVALAEVFVESGQPTRGADLLLTWAGGEELPLIPASRRPKCLGLLTRCRLAEGRREEAARAAAVAEACAAALSLPMASAMAGLALAAVELDGGDAASAADRALLSASTLDGVGNLFEGAVARTLAGRAFAEAGEQDRAVVELERAAAAFESFGSLRYRDQAERELRRLGRRIHRRTRTGKSDGSGVESLTERELQVARLVVDRLTNPEIAEALFLSPKTVETHMRNLFRKLNVSSRVEVARTVEQADRAVRTISTLT
jgi:ATP/maltotriose-dependent transcriptional regulator MalT